MVKLMSKEKLHARRKALWAGTVLAVFEILRLWWQSSGFQNLLVAHFLMLRWANTPAFRCACLGLKSGNPFWNRARAKHEGRRVMSPFSHGKARCKYLQRAFLILQSAMQRKGGNVAYVLCMSSRLRFSGVDAATSTCKFSNSSVSISSGIWRC